MTEVQKIVLAVVTEYQSSSAGYADVKIGSVTVTVNREDTGRGPQLHAASVDVSWPSLGAVNAAKAVEFSQHLTQAAHVAQGIELALKGL